MNVANDFQNYALKHMGIPSLEFYNWEQAQNRIYGPSASMTPYIVEERQLRVTQIDIFSRMMMDRILWLVGPVNDMMSTFVQAQLMWLDEVGGGDITLHIDSPGGSVKSGLSMVDVMNYVDSDIITINTGMAASMGSILLGSGTLGKRFALPNSKVMLHQVSSGAFGNIQDMEISMAESKKANKVLFEMLGKYTKKTPEQVLSDATRDLWFDCNEALAYGIIDGIVTKKVKKR
jgi:ATP-dependent Clp protease protease subunit